VLGDFKNHGAVHLDEAAIAIVGEARVVAFGSDGFDGFVIQAEVEDGIHHAGHGELGAGAHADQQRVGCVAELLAHAAFQRLEGVQHLLVNFGRDGELVVEIDIAHLG
jgi:hypothetical protein